MFAIKAECIHSTCTLSSLTQLIGQRPGFLLEGDRHIQALAPGLFEISDCLGKAILCHQQGFVGNILPGLLCKLGMDLG